ncbi:hypothetical protein L1987_84531 [Smallanthus sonchifolius]|uniref:Uncharacterized protein n=1 Tax=Smallanthus sonchifolius TaxID=185202 RepID=A0ACB8YE84_9ASTR|nr:hypothetical protein L1987_84531 [Smallanthus sonchifolius]
MAESHSLHPCNNHRRTHCPFLYDDVHISVPQSNGMPAIVNSLFVKEGSGEGVNMHIRISSFHTLRFV